MHGNYLTVNMDPQTSSHMFLKNNSIEALHQIIFPLRERKIFGHLVFYYILLYCGFNEIRNLARVPPKIRSGDFL